MKTVSAYQCSICEKIYPDKQEANSCEKSCKIYKKKEEKQRLIDSQLEDLINFPRLNAKNIKELEEMILKISKKIHGKNPLLSVSLKVRYYDNLSCSHSAPIGKKTVWGREEGIKHYPGFSGKIYYKYQSGETSDYFGRGKSCIKGINTGTGSGGGFKECYGHYDVMLWLDDFPLIKESLLKQRENEELIYNETLRIASLISEAQKIDSGNISDQAHIKALQNTEREIQNKIGDYYASISDRNSEISKPFNEELREFIEKNKVENPLL